MKKCFLFAVLGLVCVGTVRAQEQPIAETIAESVEVPGTPIENIKPNTRPLTVVAELSGGNRLSGTLVNSDQLSMKTSFGEAAIPLSEVAGLRLASGDDVSTTVVMLNGDSITGAVDLKQITIETDWGTANVKGSAILSLLFVPNVQWQASSNLSGRRWTLIDSKPAVQALAPGAQVAPGSNATVPARVNSSQPNVPAFRNGVIISQ
jgi:hypothetical protein